MKLSFPGFLTTEHFSISRGKSRTWAYMLCEQNRFMPKAIKFMGHWMIPENAVPIRVQRGRPPNRKKKILIPPTIVESSKEYHGWLSPKEYALHYGVPAQHVYLLLTTGKIPKAVKVDNKHWRIPPNAAPINSMLPRVAGRPSKYHIRIE